ncbi:MAG: VOC family protein [Burkholderiaceae bacterium]|nr:VOC family protein [Burkholderiaceae bacterium]
MTRPNAVVWFDLYVGDMDRAVTFYEQVLQCTLTPIADPTGETQMMGFSTEMAAYGAGGALVKTASARPGAGGTLVYFGVDDCAQEQSRVVAAGGKLVRPKFSIGAFGWVALCEDSEGNLFGLSSRH